MHYEVDYLKNYLKEYNINPSNIRLQLLDILLSKKNHPTAFNLYEELLKSIPTLSKTSIYNTLDIFIENNLVKAINIDEGESRFDIVTNDHGHFKCRVCGKIFDFDLGERDYKDLSEFQIIDEKVQLYGICKDCIVKSHK